MTLAPRISGVSSIVTPYCNRSRSSLNDRPRLTSERKWKTVPLNRIIESTREGSHTCDKKCASKDHVVSHCTSYPLTFSFNTSCTLRPNSSTHRAPLLPSSIIVAILICLANTKASSGSEGLASTSGILMHGSVGLSTYKCLESWTSVAIISDSSDRSPAARARSSVERSVLALAGKANNPPCHTFWSASCVPPNSSRSATSIEELASQAGRSSNCDAFPCSLSVTSLVSNACIERLYRKNDQGRHQQNKQTYQQNNKRNPAKRYTVRTTNASLSLSIYIYIYTVDTPRGSRNQN